MPEFNCGIYKLYIEITLNAQDARAWEGGAPQRSRDREGRGADGDAVPTN
jgi:hypothetical protein